MKIKTNLYAKAKEYSRFITEVVTELETITSMIDNGLVNEEKMNPKFEQRQLQDIKNALSNIYLLLDLHKVEGIADQIFDTKFVKK